MNKKVKNIKELASLLNLSVTTVSRVLNGKAEKYRISSSTGKIVLDAAREFNYYPNKIARGLRLEKTDTLGLIVPDIANPYFASIAKTIESEARSHGYSLILCDSMDDIESEKELLSLLAGHQVEGIIVAPAGHSGKYIEEFRKKDIPLVIIDRYLTDTSVNYITTDNYAGALEAVEYLINSGHTKIACIQGLKGISINNDRVKGYMDALARNNLHVNKEMILGDDFSQENGYFHTRILMNREDRPTAIFSLSNTISLGVLRALTEMDLKIPDVVSLVSFDDQPYFEFLASPMTTVDQRKEEIAKLAVNVLLESISGVNVKKKIRIMLKPRLIIRKSVKKIEKNKLSNSSVN